MRLNYSRIISLCMFLVLALTASAEDRHWDFTNWSEETKANLKVESDATTLGTLPTLWRDWEGTDKKAIRTEDKCYWYGGTTNTEPSERTANGKIIKELAGLLFINEKEGALAIAVDYDTTSFGTYAGRSYLWMGSSNQTITIPNVVPGSKITMNVESHKTTEGRGVGLYVNGEKIAITSGSETPTVKQECVWEVPTTYSTSTVDVVIKNNKGCHIYNIDIVEPKLEVELLHTAGAGWASAAGEGATVDSEGEYYNLDSETSWAGVAFAKFKVSVPKNLTVTNATLTWGCNQYNNSQYASTIYYLNPEVDVDFVNFSSMDPLSTYRYIGQKTWIEDHEKLQGVKTTGKLHTGLTTDVTAAVKAITEGGQDYIIFQWTNNSGSARLCGKGSDNAPTLTITTAEANLETCYTITYKDGVGNELKPAKVTSGVLIGAEATASDSDMASIYTEDNTKKFIYASGNETITLAADSASNVINLVFREAEVWSYKANAVNESNEIIKTLVEGTGFEDDILSIPYPKYFNIEGSLIEANANGNDFHTYPTLDQNEKVINITYKSTAITDVVFFGEAEEVAGLTPTADGNANIRCSNALGGYNAGEEAVELTTLPRGIYSINTVVWGNSGVDLLLQCNDSVYKCATKGYIQTYTFENITVTKPTQVLLPKSGTATKCFDYFYIQKTGSLPEPETAYIVFADSTYAMSADKVNDGDITEPKVITTGSLTTTIYPSTTSTVNRFWKVSDKPQLRIYGGKITFEVPEGKSLRSLAFTFDSSYNGNSKTANSTFNGVDNTDPALWEGNSTNVVYEVAAQARIKTITAIIEDADAETTTYAPAPEPLPVAENIAALKAMENNTAVELKVKNAKVTFKNGNNIYIEDTTGALLLYNLGVEMTEGKEITGSLKGKFTMFGKVAELIANDSTANSSIVETLGEQFLGTEMTVAEANKLDNISKMAVLKDLPIVEKGGKHYLVSGTDTIMIYDKFKVLSAEYVWPTEVSQITGIIDNYNGVNQLAPLAEYAIVAKANIMEAENIASLNNYESGTVVKLMLNNAQVIMNSNNQYQMVIGDNTGSVVIGSDSHAMFNNTGKFAEGNILNGYVVAKANKENGNWKLVANEDIFKEDVTFTEGTVEPLPITVAEAQYYVGRYVEFNNVVAEPDQYDGYVGNIKQGEATLPFEDLWWQLDEAIKAANYDYFRGILLYNNEGEITLNLYGAGDLKPVVITPIPVAEINKIGDLKDLNDGTPVKLTVENAIVSVCEIKMAGFSQAPFMVLEDNTGGVQLEVGDGYFTMYGLADIIGITNDSTQVSGTICAQYTNAFGLHELIYDESMEESTITITPGVAPTATTMTPAQIKAAGTSMDYRLIKIESPVMGYDANEYMCTLTKDGDFVYIMDDFGKLAMNEETYEPIIFENLESVYGIINSAFAESVGSNTFSPTIFVLNTTGINGVNSTVKSMGDIYNMNGVKVRNAGEDMRGLQKGMYIMNGKKIIMK